MAEDIDDDLYENAKQAVEEAGRASTSYLQRKLRIGYSRAARLMDVLEQKGVIGAADGSKPREILRSESLQPVSGTMKYFCGARNDMRPPSRTKINSFSMRNRWAGVST